MLSPYILHIFSVPIDTANIRRTYGADMALAGVGKEKTDGKGIKEGEKVDADSSCRGVLPIGKC